MTKRIMINNHYSFGQLSDEVFLKIGCFVWSLNLFSQVKQSLEHDIFIKTNSLVIDRYLH